jgi:hypothetical protein
MSFGAIAPMMRDTRAASWAASTDRERRDSADEHSDESTENGASGPFLAGRR